MQGEYHDFPSATFRHTVPKKFVGNLLAFHEVRVLNLFRHKKGVSRSSVERFLSQGTENLRNGTLLCFRNFRYRKTLWIRRVGWAGVSRFSFRKFLSHSANKVRRGTL